MRVLEKLALKKPFIRKVEKYFNINVMTDSVWEAFVIARDEVLKEPQENWMLLSARGAEKYLDGRVNRHYIAKKAEEGVLRKTEDGKYYKPEIEMLRAILNIKDIFTQAGVILPTEDISGKDVYAIIPVQIDKLKKSKFDQTFEALKLALQTPSIKVFLDKLQELEN